VGPLGECLEVVDRLPRLDLDNDLQPMSPVLRQENEIWIERRRTGANGRVLFRPRIHAGFVPAAKLPVKQANNAVVL
jgi:hypothetical protein